MPSSWWAGKLRAGVGGQPEQVGVGGRMMNGAARWQPKTVSWEEMADEVIEIQYVRHENELAGLLRSHHCRGARWYATICIATGRGGAGMAS